jgi:hypothetical protein
LKRRATAAGSFTGTKGESAKTTDRTELQNLLKYCRTQKGKVHFVVVYNLTRFAREKYDHFALRAHLKSLGFALRSATEPIDDTSTGKLVEGVLPTTGYMRLVRDRVLFVWQQVTSDVKDRQRDRLREELTLAQIDATPRPSRKSTWRESWRSQSAFYRAPRTSGYKPRSIRSSGTICQVLGAGCEC